MKVSLKNILVQNSTSWLFSVSSVIDVENVTIIDLLPFDWEASFLSLFETTLMARSLQVIQNAPETRFFKDEYLYHFQL